MVMLVAPALPCTHECSLFCAPRTRTSKIRRLLGFGFGSLAFWETGLLFTPGLAGLPKLNLRTLVFVVVQHSHHAVPKELVEPCNHRVPPFKAQCGFRLSAAVRLFLSQGIHHLIGSMPPLWERWELSPNCSPVRWLFTQTGLSRAFSSRIGSRRSAVSGGAVLLCTLEHMDLQSVVTSNFPLALAHTKPSALTSDRYTDCWPCTGPAAVATGTMLSPSTR